MLAPGSLVIEVGRILADGVATFAQLVDILLGAHRSRRGPASPAAVESKQQALRCGPPGAEHGAARLSKAAGADQSSGVPARRPTRAPQHARRLKESAPESGRLVPLGNA